MDNWPFADPKNVAVITLRQIMKGEQPILHVSHDEEDGQWQFLSLETPSEKDAMIVGLGEVINRDSSVAELADLPFGWHAWRNSVSDPWKREQSPKEEET